MGAVTTTSFELQDSEGRRCSRLVISTLPNSPFVAGIPTLIDARNERVESSLEPVQLLEGCEYVYEIDAPSNVELDKPELFVADDHTGRRGRLRTKLATGRVAVRALIDGAWSKPIAFEIRSAKLGYLDDYRWMLESIAEVGAGLLLERFAASEQRFQVDPEASADTLYQQFVFLQGLLTGERLVAALQRIVAEPYVQWEAIDEPVPPGRGARGGGALARQLVRPGPRQAWPNSPHLHLETIPSELKTRRTIETLDNVPNRFVLFALEEWRGLANKLREVLESASDDSNPAVVRGGRELAELELRLTEWIQAGAFESVGTLNEFPLANQVLQKKEGYREVLHAYLVVQLGASLTWDGGEDVFGGGQRNVATLYEYWVFLQLASIVSELCDEPLDVSSLVTESTHGLSLVLRRERAHVLRGAFRRRGREYGIELCFNQQFAKGPNGTWTKSLRPDCSLHIIPRERERHYDDVWVHFDAKYRVSRLEELIGEDGDQPALVAKTEDLYKMHTYRDAILRAVGAYVVFPGTEPLRLEQYEEVLPGLGAFPLRPTKNGESLGSAHVRQFLLQTFDHIASQTTRHERARYWRRAATTGPRSVTTADAVAFLNRPPADTPVLLGYSKSRAHYDWIVTNRRYNLRADPNRRGSVGLRGVELSADLIAVYGEIGDGSLLFKVVQEPQIVTSEDLQDSGYPSPRGHLYFCFVLEPVKEVPRWCDPSLFAAAALAFKGDKPDRAPIVVTWGDLAELSTRRPE